MFTKIDFSLVKKQIPDYGVLQLDTSRINPPNLQYKILRDGSFDFQKKNEVNKDDIINVHVDSDNSYLKNVICNMYFYYNNFGIDLTSYLVFPILGMNEISVSQTCSLFKSVIIDENYHTQGSNITQALQVTGLSIKGLDFVCGLLKNDKMLNSLYGNQISNDLVNTECFLFQDTVINDEDSDYEKFVSELFENEYLRRGGTLNVSAMSLNSLNLHLLCNSLSKKVKELYLLNYDVEYNGKTVFVKYLQWF